MKLRFLHILLPVILALLAATGCRDSRTAVLLARADSVMEADPDSARALLDSIDPSRLRGSDLALYAVLDAQSRHKLNLGAPSDSLLNIAVDRYTAHGPDSLLMKALFYRAVGYQQAGDIENAVVDAMGSWVNAESIGNEYWQAKSAELVADLFRDSFNYREEAVWRGKAGTYYKQAGRQDSYMFALSDLASAYNNLREAEKSRQILDSIDCQKKEWGKIDGFLDYYFPTVIFHHLYFGSEDLVDSILSAPEYHDVVAANSSLLLAKVAFLIKKESFSEAKDILDTVYPNLPPYNRNIGLFSYVQISRGTHDFNMMSIACDSLLGSQFDLLDTALSQPVAGTQRDYFQQVATDYKARNKKSRITLIVIIVGSLLLLSVCVAMYRFVIKRKEILLQEKIRHIFSLTNRLRAGEEEREGIKNQFEILKNEYDSLKGICESHKTQKDDSDRQLSDLKKMLDKTKKEIKGLSATLAHKTLRMPEIYKERWEILNILFSELYTGENKGTAKKLMTEIKEELQRLRSEEFLDAMAKELDEDMNNIITRLIQQCKKLSAEDIRICILTFSGMENTTIALIFDISVETLYVRRNRIRDRIRRSSPKDIEEFIGKLSN